MSYVDGFLIAVPAENKQAYIEHAKSALPFFKELGVKRIVECWGDDVSDGKVTDFRKAVQAKEDEIVVFSWFERPDKATRDVGVKKMMDDPRMKEMEVSTPFDGQRMIFGGFELVVDE